MKKSKFTEQQTAFALWQAESGTTVGEVCRKMGIAEATFYLYGRLSRCKTILIRSALASCKHLSGVTRWIGAPKWGIRSRSLYSW